MKKIFFTIACLLTFLSSNIYALDQQVWKVTYAVIDAKKASLFCQKILDMEEVKIPDATLAKGRSWVKFKNSDLQLHFVEIVDKRIGREKIIQDYQFIDKIDKNMTVFTSYMDNHAGIMVDDIDFYIAKLLENNLPFLGPIKRDDGVFQLYFEILGHAYLELDSRKEPKLAKAITWKDVNFNDK